MTKVLFVVHGMGRHEPDGSAGVAGTLAALPATYGYTWFEEHGPLADHLTVVPIDYDAVFDRVVAGWGASSQRLREAAAEVGVGIPNVLGWLERAGEGERNFFWTHVVDVLLYRFFPIVTAEVRLRVRLALAETLEARRRDGELVESSVLAHSLGTAVAHDALALLGSQPVPTDAGPNAAWMAGRHTFANVFMCANVSRVLETEPKVYQSVVRPPGAGAGPSYVDAYYNFRHRLDPFPMVRPFAPIGWGDRYLEVGDCRQLLHFNVHGIRHYLEDPRVHVPILRATVARWAVTDAQWAAANTRYDASPEPPCAAEVVRFKAAAEQIIALARTGGGPEALVIGGAQFLAAAREAADACA